MSIHAQRSFSGPNLLQVALPLGGMGAGCVCLNGFGGLQDFSIRNRPALTALQDGHAAGDGAFAVLHMRGKKPVTKLVEGPFPPERIYDQGLQGQGYRKSGHEGFPRFGQAVFRGAYPCGEVTLSDKNVPLEARVLGWSPLIPGDGRNSGLPCAILEYTFTNTSARRVDFQFSYHVSHLAIGAKTGEKGTRNAVIPNRGIFFSNTEAPLAETFGNAALVALSPLAPAGVEGLGVRGTQRRDNPSPLTPHPRGGRGIGIKAMWHRGRGWCHYDSMTTLWRELSAGKLTANSGSPDADNDGRNGGSLFFDGSLKPGASVTYSLALCWHFPNCYVTAGTPACDQPGCCCPPPPEKPAWRPYYAGQWQDARAVALYLAENFGSLRRRTFAFQQALFGSTLPPQVLDAVSANLGILKSPTLLRQENGNVWGWEGCFAHGGCCHGSCTHVWNYAQALPHLFPKLERTLREQELERSMNAEGSVKFRANLPDSFAQQDWHAAADGQLGGIMKVFRDWQIAGDGAWLEKMFPLAKRSLDFCIRHWDPDERGALFEPHHNTYDIEFWGPNGMCTSIYIGALAAAAQMAAALGQNEDAARYRKLAERGARFMDKNLFNGEYFAQKIMYKNLRDKSFVELLAKMGASPSPLRGEGSGVRGRRADITPEQQILKREGPKYQYGNGCLSDGVIGAWMAEIYGIDAPFSREKVRATLRAIFRHNFRTDLSEHACTQRPGYAMGREGGLLLCSWPHHDQPTLPFIYCDEVWTGIEYQVASHLIAAGCVAEGLAIVQAARARYDGRARNPWNEYECGNYYARAMSSYALLGALAGFRYSAVEKTLWLAPKISKRPFKTFFAAASGFGTITLTRKALAIEMVEGELAVENVVVNGREVKWGVVAKAGEKAELKL